jgi:hypothetical protein
LFSAGDIPLAVLLTGAPSGSLSTLTGPAPIPTSSSIELGRRQGSLTSDGGDAWHLGFVLGPVPFTRSGTHTATITFTATGL